MSAVFKFILLILTGFLGIVPIIRSVGDDKKAEQEQVEDHTHEVR